MTLEQVIEQIKDSMRDATGEKLERLKIKLKAAEKQLEKSR